MVVSTRGRYALRIMIDLAEHERDGFIPLPIIAGRQEISEKYLESIINSLVKAKLVTGLRGKGGGYKLTKDSESYTLGQILRAAEGNFQTVSCLNDENECSRAPTCKTLPIWKELDDLINTFLDGKNLKEITFSRERGNDYVI